MQTRTSSRTTVGLLFILLASLLSTPSAEAAPLVAPSTVWGHTYAVEASTKVISVPVTQSANLEKRSKFVVNYKNFPDWAKNQVQAAIDLWAANFDSKVQINVDATWGRSSATEVLGSARPDRYYARFAGAPDSSLWYASALANAIVGKDLDLENPEVIIQINSEAEWDLDGLGKPTRNEYDLKSVMFHELAHGLGFLSTSSFLFDRTKGQNVGILEQPTAFDAYLQTIDGNRLIDLPSPSFELGQALTTKLVWSGTEGVIANQGVKPIMYTPSNYDAGSSVSHLDENTFTNSGINEVMTPNLQAGEVFNEPGPILLAMMKDLRNKPSPGLAAGVPSEVLNPQALIADSSAILTFDPPFNSRTTQVSEYIVKNLNTGREKTFTDSPAVITGLKNGTSYIFEIIASNSKGTSPKVMFKAVTPRASWSSKVLDPAAEARSIASASLNGKPVIAYIDSISSTLRLASWSGKVWKTKTIDSDISGKISLCASGKNLKQTLHIFYSDKTNNDLRYARVDGPKISREIVDGNASKVQPYEEIIRVPTASNVSVSNACAITSEGIQVFYRDETQGVLLGAFKNFGGNWNYELVDGDRKTDFRTTGDVAFHLKALVDRNKTYVIYDSVLTINQNRDATSGEIRVATRTSFDPGGWKYRTLESPATDVTIFGYDVEIAKSAKGIMASWFSATVISMPDPTQIRTLNLSTATGVLSTSTSNYGTPNELFSSDLKTLLFNCLGRLCAIDYAKFSKGQSSIVLASSWQSTEPIASAWIKLNKVRYVVAGIKGKLVLLKAA
ncbi:MAG: fibronectin [Actinobacteria bacterium]|nr:fibronectin [Actinomycetota bacterium]